MMQNEALAWFAQNDNVEANGFDVSAKVTPNLVIAGSVEDIISPDILKNGSPFGVDFDDEIRDQMAAATHDSESASGSYLHYVTNAEDIDMTTGYGKPGAELIFAEVAEDENSIFYFDCVVYVASAGTALDVESLTATFESDQALDVEENPSHFAASIDFYLGEVSAEGYKGTLSLAEALEGEKTELYEGEIPLNTERYLTVIMRFYFDGDLKNPANNYAYINSDTVVINETVKFSVSFEAV